MQTAASEAQHSQLAEKINQVAILRESNATLRSDCETYAKRARQLEAELRQATEELEPIKEQLRVAQAEIEAKDQQVKMLENESQRWQERNTQLLTKVSVLFFGRLATLMLIIDFAVRSYRPCGDAVSQGRNCQTGSAEG